MSRSLLARFSRNPNEPTSLGTRPVHTSISAATASRSRSSRSSCCRKDAYSAAALAYSSGGNPLGSATPTRSPRPSRAGCRPHRCESRWCQVGRAPRESTRRSAWLKNRLDGRADHRGPTGSIESALPGRCACWPCRAATHLAARVAAAIPFRLLVGLHFVGTDRRGKCGRIRPVTGPAAEP